MTLIPGQDPFPRGMQQTVLRAQFHDTHILMSSKPPEFSKHEYDLHQKSLHW